MKSNLFAIFLISVMIIVSSCENNPSANTNEPKDNAQSQIANPASVFCEENGGRLEIRTMEDGSQAGYCILENGTECDEWDYYRGNCPEEQVQEKEEKINLENVPPTIDKTPTGVIAETQLLSLESWTDNKVSMDVPEGWDVFTRGECPTKSILARDPENELKQVFYISEAGPVYINQAQKDWEDNYVAIGGSPMPWSQSPMVDPLTAENFLLNFGELTSADFFREAFPEATVFTDVKIISAEKAEKPNFAEDAKLIRAEFVQDGKSGEGYFYIVTAKVSIGEGMGYGMVFMGITAPEGMLDLLVPSLKKSIESFVVSQEYVDACIKANNKAVAGALEAGKILSETSDTIMDAWDSRMEAEDRMSEKQSDATLGYSRLYNPDTDEVYEVTPEFVDYYETHSNEFEMNNLQELSGNQWGYAPLNGGLHIR